MKRTCAVSERSERGRRGGPAEGWPKNSSRLNIRVIDQAAQWILEVPMPRETVCRGDLGLRGVSAYDLIYKLDPCPPNLLLQLTVVHWLKDA